MNTIATWCERNDEGKRVTDGKLDDVLLDVHINFWKLLNRAVKRNEYLLDMGFKINDISKLSKFNVHFPFKIDRCNLQDLGKVLIDNKQIVNSIFNEHYQIHDGKVSKQLSIQDSEGLTLFNIYAIDFSQDVNDCIICDKWGGSLLTLDLSRIQHQCDCSKYYFRFRLKGDVAKKFRREHKPEARYFQSAFTATETIDFRLNEKRNYQASLSETIKSENEFKIKNIHFLLLRKSNDDFESKHINASCRELEPELWGKYVGDQYDLDNILAYHWSDKRPDGDKCIDSFNTLVKMKYNKSSVLTVMIYLLVLWSFSIIFNVSSGYIKDKIDSKISKHEKISSNVKSL